MKIYILAGGKSSRMGTDKGLKLLNNKPLITYLIGTLQQNNYSISIISQNDDYKQFNLPLVADIIPEKGPLGGIFTVLSHVKEDTLILSVDTPFMELKNIEFLIQQHQKNKITVAINDDKIYPLFGIYPYHLCNAIEEKIKTNELKLMNFLKENAHQTNKINIKLSEIEKLNINTETDFTTAKKLLNNGN